MLSYSNVIIVLINKSKTVGKSSSVTLLPKFLEGNHDILPGKAKGLGNKLLSDTTIPRKTIIHQSRSVFKKIKTFSDDRG